MPSKGTFISCICGHNQSFKKIANNFVITIGVQTKTVNNYKLFCLFIEYNK